MAGLPLLKLGGLAMKTLAKPVVRAYAVGFACSTDRLWPAAASGRLIPPQTITTGQAAQERGRHTPRAEATVRECGPVDAPRDGVDHHQGRRAQEPGGALW